MSFSGDSIVIKDDLTFERIENLRLGDVLIGPNGKEAIITKIQTTYNETNILLKGQNFFPFYVGLDTEILTSKQFELFNSSTNEYEMYIKPEEFMNIKNISPINFLCLPLLTFEKKVDFQNPFLYGLVLMNGDLIEKDNEKNIVGKNINKYIPKIAKTDDSLNVSKYGNSTYINNVNYYWCQDLKCKIHQRKINNNLFISSSKDKETFLNNIIKNNTKMYINEKEFRCYNESKILDIQLFYLLSDVYKKLPSLELVEKDRVEYKKIAQSHKKKKYAITMLQDDEVLFKNNIYFQEIEMINSIKKNIKMYSIETLNNEPFYLNNIVVRK